MVEGVQSVGVVLLDNMVVMYHNLVGPELVVVVP